MTHSCVLLESCRKGLLQLSSSLFLAVPAIGTVHRLGCAGAWPIWYCSSARPCCCILRTRHELQVCTCVCSNPNDASIAAPWCVFPRRTIIVMRLSSCLLRVAWATAAAAMPGMSTMFCSNCQCAHRDAACDRYRYGVAPVCHTTALQSSISFRRCAGPFVLCHLLAMTLTCL